MSSLSETLYRIEELKQQLATWHSVTNHLARFLDTETREATDGIQAPGCVRPELRVRGKEVVPQDIIYNIIQGVEAEKISPLLVEIASLENLKVETRDDHQSQEEQPEVRSQQKNQKRVRVVAKPG